MTERTRYIDEVCAALLDEMQRKYIMARTHLEQVTAASSMPQEKHADQIEAARKEYCARPRNIWQSPLKQNFWELIWNETYSGGHHRFRILNPAPFCTRLAQLPRGQCGSIQILPCRPTMVRCGTRLHCDGVIHNVDNSHPSPQHDGLSPRWKNTPCNNRNSA